MARTRGRREVDLRRGAFPYVRAMVLVVLLLASARLVQIHLRNGVEAEEARLGISEMGIELPRARLLDRNGKALAESLFVYDVQLECWANRGFPREVAEALVAIVEKHRALSDKERAQILGRFELPAHAKDLWETPQGDAKSKGRHRYYWIRPLFKQLQDPALIEELREFRKESTISIVEAAWDRDLDKEEKRICRRDWRFDLEFVPRWNRYYPLGAAASSITGILSKAKKVVVIEGKERIEEVEVNYGLEKQPLLSSQGERHIGLRRGLVGRSGRKRALVFAPGNESLELPGEIGVRSLVTTIDGEIQEFAYEALGRAADAVVKHYSDPSRAKTVAKPGIDWAVGVVLDLQSGDLLAATGLPSYDPNRFQPGDNLMASTHQRLFAPGSIIKPLLVGLTMDRGLVRPGQTIACQGTNGGRVWRHGPRRITDDHPVGIVPLEILLAESSNIGAVRVGILGGPEVHSDLLALLDHGRAPRIGLPLQRYMDKNRRGRVVEGSVPSEKQLRDRQYPYYTGPSISFGYQMNLYPLGFAQAFASLVTGREFKLRLLDRLITADGDVRYFPQAGPGKRIFKESTVRWTRETLKMVITHERGTARRIAGPGVSGILAGKTGTSVTPPGASLEKRENTASFIGFWPADDPKYLAMVTIRRTGGKAFYGGLFAAPPVRDCLLYLQHREASGRDTHRGKSSVSFQGGE